MNPIFEKIDLRRTFENAKICNGQLTCIDEEERLKRKKEFYPKVIRVKEELYSENIGQKRDFTWTH